LPNQNKTILKKYKLYYPKKAVKCGVILQDTGFKVLSKTLVLQRWMEGRGR
jgi:hypothetical protein